MQVNGKKWNDNIMSIYLTKCYKNVFMALNAFHEPGFQEAGNENISTTKK